MAQAGRGIPCDRDWSDSIKWWEATHSHASIYTVPWYTPQKRHGDLKFPWTKSLLLKERGWGREGGIGKKKKQHPIFLLICPALGCLGQVGNQQPTFFCALTGRKSHILRLQPEKGNRRPPDYIWLCQHLCSGKRKKGKSKRQDVNRKALTMGLYCDK